MSEQQIQILTEQEYIVSQWSGGSTTQIAIAPDKAQYADRDFLWRTSSATVDLPESDFTPLPDYMRYISVLKGGMELTHEQQQPTQLTPYDVHYFDGEVATRSVGKCVDFNLMLRKGQCEGSLKALYMATSESITFRTQDITTKNPAAHSLVLYCAEGNGTITLADKTLQLAAGQSLYIKQVQDLDATLACTGPSGFMLAKIVEFTQ